MLHIQLNEENKLSRNLRKQHSIENGIYQKFQESDFVRQECANWLSKNSPKYVITLIGSPYIPQPVSRELLNWFCYKMNEMILKRSFNGKGGKNELEIFVCRENAETQQKNSGVQWLNSDHYHVWFKNAESYITYDYCSFKNIVFKAVIYANDKYKKSLIEVNSVYKPHYFKLGENIDIQSYYNLNGLNYEWYTTKVFEDFSLSVPEMINHIGVYDGVTRSTLFGSIKFDEYTKVNRIIDF